MSSSPNSKTVVIIGALDTKGAEFAFVKGLIEAEGVDTLVVDFGTMGGPELEPDITRAEVATAAGGDISYLCLGRAQRRGDGDHGEGPRGSCPQALR